MTNETTLFCSEPGCNRDRIIGAEYCIHHLPKDTVLKQYAPHPGSVRFHEILRELGDLHNLKQRDYGRADDPFANVRASGEWGVDSWVGAMIRATDKLRRLQTFAQNGKLANEGVEDSLRDLAVYAIIALVLFEQCSKQGK